MRQALSGAAMLAAALILHGCGSSRFDIVGHAMSPTLEDGQSVLGTRSFDEIRRGDIVALRSPRDESKSFVKRVVGLPGDRIQSTEGTVTVHVLAAEVTADPVIPTTTTTSLPTANARPAAGALPATGSPSAPLLVGGALLLAGGAALVVVARRRID